MLGVSVWGRWSDWLWRWRQWHWVVQVHTMWHALCANCMKLMVKFFFLQMFYTSIAITDLSLLAFRYINVSETDRKRLVLSVLRFLTACLFTSAVRGNQTTWSNQYHELLVRWNRPRVSCATSVPPPAPAPSLTVCHTPAPDISTCSNAVPRLEMQDLSCIQKPSQTSHSIILPTTALI